MIYLPLISGIRLKNVRQDPTAKTAVFAFSQKLTQRRQFAPDTDLRGCVSRSKM